MEQPKASADKFLIALEAAYSLLIIGSIIAYVFFGSTFLFSKSDLGLVALSAYYYLFITVFFSDIKRSKFWGVVALFFSIAAIWFLSSHFSPTPLQLLYLIIPGIWLAYTYFRYFILSDQEAAGTVVMGILALLFSLPFMFVFAFLSGPLKGISIYKGGDSDQLGIFFFAISWNISYLIILYLRLKALGHAQSGKFDLDAFFEEQKPKLGSD